MNIAKFLKEELFYRTPQVAASFFFKKVINTLTANYEYSRNNTHDLQLPVQMQLSGKLKTFSRFFIAFFESTSNFEHSSSISERYTPKDVFT